LRNKIKNQVATVLPYIAVFGTAAVAAYAASKLYKAVKSIDIPLDFGNDINLSKHFKKD